QSQTIAYTAFPLLPTADLLLICIPEFPLRTTFRVIVVGLSVGVCIVNVWSEGPAKRTTVKILFNTRKTP
ncbi:hypothetical protein PoMZ_09399, partial [Pyricularia oryzae]